MAKRRFRVDAGGRGGELCIGEVNKDFVDFMIDNGEYDDVSGYISGYGNNFDDWPKGIPFVSDPKEIFEWEECDDIEHLNNIYINASVNGFSIIEVPADGSDDGAYEDDATPCIQGFELYLRDAIPDQEVSSLITQEGLDNYIPVLVFHNSEKGVFASWFVETGGEDFDPKKLAFSTVVFGTGKFNFSPILENVWYDKIKLRAEHDFITDLGSQGYYAQVGYMNPKKLDNPLKDPTDEFLTVEGFWGHFERRNATLKVDVKEFREDKGVEDYFKSKLKVEDFVVNIVNKWWNVAKWSRSQEVDMFLDNLGDALQWVDMKKGESKEVGTVSVFCVDSIIDIDEDGNAEGEILIMLTYDEYPDDTIKIRFEVECDVDEDDNKLYISGQSTYYLDSEGQENPVNYSNFLELYQILNDLVYN
tara:strand:- start:86 stop:1339 length:1254 start_codon:yes stop_codon:yes gene_type:complete